MMLTLTAGSASELFAQACHAVLAPGKLAAPRGLATVEVLGASLILTDPRRRLVDVPPVRVINPAFAAAEAAWILSGSDDPVDLPVQRAARRVRRRWPADGRLRAAAAPLARHDRPARPGPGRLSPLTRAPGGRSSSSTTRKPTRAATRTCPCTLGYRFFLRDGMLHMHTTMRSQDLWLGFCYDIFTATVLQELLAGWLGAGLGHYAHASTPCTCTPTTSPRPSALPPEAMPRPADDLACRTVWETFDGCSPPSSPAGPGKPGWSEMSAVLASYRPRKAGDPDAADATLARHARPAGRALRRWYQLPRRRAAAQGGPAVREQRPHSRPCSACARSPTTPPLPSSPAGR